MGRKGGQVRNFFLISCAVENILYKHKTPAIKNRKVRTRSVTIVEDGTVSQEPGNIKVMQLDDYFTAHTLGAAPLRRRAGSAGWS